MIHIKSVSVYDETDIADLDLNEYESVVTGNSLSDVLTHLVTAINEETIDTENNLLYIFETED